MKRFVLRVWLPDKPGALGRVASAIGAVGASLIGIDIIEQDAGYAVDELTVDAVDSPNAAEKLIASLTLVEGVNVEDIRERSGSPLDARTDAWETAADLVEASDAAAAGQVLVERSRHDMGADWVVLLETSGQRSVCVSGEPPTPAWINAFVAGSRSSRQLGVEQHGPEDIAWTELTKAGLALVLGRSQRPFRSRERRQLDALARIADRRLAELDHGEFRS